MTEDKRLRAVPPTPTGPTVTGGAAPRTTVSPPGENKGAHPRPVARPAKGPSKGPVGGSGQAKAGD